MVKIKPKSQGALCLRYMFSLFPFFHYFNSCFVLFCFFFLFFCFVLFFFFVFSGFICDIICLFKFRFSLFYVLKHVRLLDLIIFVSALFLLLLFMG